MTAVQLAPLPGSPLPGHKDWQGVRDAIELFILERRADKNQPSTIRYYRQQLGLFSAWLTQQDVPGDVPEDVTEGVQCENCDHNRQALPYQVRWVLKHICACIPNH